MSIDIFSKKGISKSNSSNVEPADPIFKKNTWNYNKGEGFNISLTADKVAFIDVDGKEEVCDKPVWRNRVDKIFDAVVKSIKSDCSKYCPPPVAVEIIFKSSADTKLTNPSLAEVDKQISKEVSAKDETILVREPRWTFNDVYIEPKMLDEINRTLLIARHREKLFNEWKLGNGQKVGRAIVFNFYGSSGTGKSMTGEAIAAQLGKKLYVVNYSELESKYVGETPKNIVAAFRKAQDNNAVLIFDEADSFLGKRLTNVTQSADYGVNITRSVMLMELEKFDGIVIFTTNLVTNYDEAFKRRILTSIKFELPDELARRKIWKIYLSRGLPLADELTPEILAKKYDGISGADIKDILLHAAVSALYRDESNPLINSSDFDVAYKMILSRRTNKTELPKVTITNETISAEQFESETGGQQP